MADEDADRVSRWQRGDVAAFAEIVARWQRPVARFLSRLAHADRVPDLTQDVFVRVLRAGSRYRPTAKFTTWLFQIALNVARDESRRQRLLPQHLVQDMSVENEFDHRELTNDLAIAVNELPLAMREVIALRHDQDMSFEEMARVLDAPASTLKSRFAAALNRLRIRMHQMGYSPEESRP